MRLTLRHLAAALLVGILCSGFSAVPILAIDIDIDVDVGNPLDIVTKPKPKPKPKPAPAKPAPAKPKPAAVTIAKLPAKSEKRLYQNQVLIETRKDITPEALAGITTRNGLRLIETADIVLFDDKVHLFEIVNGKQLRTVLSGLNNERDIILAQPNYIYALLEDAAPTTPVAATAPPQYPVDILHLVDAHTLATGKAIKIGILDTAIAPSEAELAGSVAMSFDGIGPTENDNPSHGTALAGIVAAHGQLLGVAPSAAILSARAFVSTDGKPPASSSFLLLKGLDWLSSNGAQIVNMSFAGPSDPLFLKEIKAARDRGILSIAAAGNDGPKAAPDFPAADPSALGVTATDDLNAIFAQANRGDYVAVSAPGVDILVLAPDGTFSTSSGTSMAAAHVTGAIALLLERNPTLKPDDIVRVLTTTAVDLGKKGRDKIFGAGLVDPQKALGELPAPAPLAEPVTTPAQ